MSKLTILAILALGVLAVLTAFALVHAKTRRRQHAGVRASDSTYVPGAWDASAGHSSCDSGASAGDSGGGGDCGGAH